MTTSIVYVDRSEVKPGALSDLRKAVSDLVAFVQEREPQLLAYGFYIDDAALTMTVVAVHPDSASLEFHLGIGGPEFRKVGPYITLRSVEVFGEVSESAMSLLKEKARALGNARVVVRSAHAGFTTLGGRPGASSVPPSL